MGPGWRGARDRRHSHWRRGIPTLRETAGVDWRVHGFDSFAQIAKPSTLIEIRMFDRYDVGRRLKSQVIERRKRVLKLFLQSSSRQRWSGKPGR